MGGFGRRRRAEGEENAGGTKLGEKLGVEEPNWRKMGGTGFGRSQTRGKIGGTGFGRPPPLPIQTTTFGWLVSFWGGPLFHALEMETE